MKISRSWTPLAPALALALALALAGCGTPAAGPVPQPTVTVTQTVEPTPVDSATSPSPSPEGTDSASPQAAPWQSAIQLAEQTAGGTAVSVEWNVVSPRWEVEVLNGNTLHEVHLSIEGTSVTKNESEDADAEEVSLLQQAKVSLADAIETVLAAHPGDLHEADLTTRRNQVIWEVEVVSSDVKTEYYVDAVTGQIV